MQKYIVVDDTYNGDQETEVFDTPKAANAEASYIWNHLTPKEQKTRHIYVAVVSESDLADDAKNDDTGAIDWRCWANCDAFPGAFDSENA